MIEIKNISDWYLSEKGDQVESVIFPSGQSVSRLDSELQAFSKNLLTECINERSRTSLVDFQINMSGEVFRVHYQNTVGGAMYMLRRTARNCPDIKDLSLSKSIVAILTSDRYCIGGGLIVICGTTGNGKSTTISSLVKDRVISQGAFCLTVEDPPEFVLHGDYISKTGAMGKIIQVPGNPVSFAEDLRGALRCYPSGARGSMLMVGETRDPDTACQILRAAVSGQLVLTTFHSSDIVACLERLLSMAKDRMGDEEARSLLAHSLRAIIHQELDPDTRKPRLSSLFSSNSSSPVASRIKQGSLNILSSEIMKQKTLHDSGILPSYVLDGKL